MRFKAEIESIDRLITGHILLKFDRRVCLKCRANANEVFNVTESCGKGKRQGNRFNPIIFMKNGMSPYFPKGDDYGFNRRSSRV
jgi:hypothetical protein